MIARSIHELLKAQARAAPDAPAVLAPGRTPLTYGRLLLQIEDAAHTLNGMGLGRHSRIGLVLPNGPEAAVSFLAVASCAVSAPLNPMSPAAEFDRLLSNLGVSALITQASMDSPAVAAARTRGIPVIDLAPRLEAEAGVFTLATGPDGCVDERGLSSGQDVALMLSTSGTTSRPRIVPLTQANICAAAQNVRAALELSPSDRCLNVMPLFHVHGLIGAVLSSITAGGSVVCAPGYVAQAFPKWLEQHGVTWYTAVPTIHQAVLARAARDRGALTGSRLRFIRSCSAPLPSRVAGELEKVFRAPVVQAYGMTEAAHQITSNPLPPRRRKPGSVGVPVGAQVAVLNSAGEALSPGEIGEIAIRGPSVADGDGADGWLRTGDEGYLDEESYLFLTGRLKEMINRGGTKIAPSEVDEVLLAHPAVAEAVTFATPHPTLGEDVAAAIVLRRDVVAPVRDIREFAARHLADFKVPRRILLMDELPKGATGKLQRIGLAARLDLIASRHHGDQLHAGAAPQTPLEEKLAEIWTRLLKRERIGVEANFFEIGGDSLLGTELFCLVSETLQVQLSLTEFFAEPTIAGQARAITQSRRHDLLPPSVVAVQSSGSKPPLFCVAPGTEVGYLTKLGMLLAPDQPLYALRPSGAVPYVPEEAAEEYVKEIRTLQPEGPYLVAGWCAGAAAALEVGRLLLDAGQEVPLLAVFTPVLYSRFNHSIGTYLKSLWSLPTRKKLDRIRGTLRALIADVRQRALRRNSRVSASAQAPAAQAREEISRAVQETNRRALRHHTRRAYPGRVALFLTDDAASSAPPSANVVDTFGRLAAGGLEVYQVSGDHASVVRDPHVRDLAHKLRCCVDKVTAT